MVLMSGASFFAAAAQGMPLDYLALVVMSLALLGPLKLLQLDVASCQTTAPDLCTDKRWSHTL